MAGQHVVERIRPFLTCVWMADDDVLVLVRQELFNRGRLFWRGPDPDLYEAEKAEERRKAVEAIDAEERAARTPEDDLDDAALAGAWL